MSNTSLESKTEIELIASFMGTKQQADDHYYFDTKINGHHVWRLDQMKYQTSWDWLMPVVTHLLKSLRIEKWQTRDQYEWAEVHRTHLERRLFDYIYDDTTSQSDFVQEIIESIKWYNSQKEVQEPSDDASLFIGS